MNCREMDLAVDTASKMRLELRCSAHHRRLTAKTAPISGKRQLIAWESVRGCAPVVAEVFSASNRGRSGHTKVVERTL